LSHRNWAFFPQEVRMWQGRIFPRPLRSDSNSQKEKDEKEKDDKEKEQTESWFEEF